MANSPAIFSALKGKKITLQGKFDRYERPSIEEMIRLQQGKLVDDLDKSVDYLVVSDMSSGMPAQRKAQSLNSKGASIKVLDIAGLDTIACPKVRDIIEIIRMGKSSGELLSKATCRLTYYRRHATRGNITITGESFDGLDLSGFRFESVYFDRCSFVGITGAKTKFSLATNCNFERAKVTEAEFWNVSGSQFSKSIAMGTEFHGVDGADFTEASLKKCRFLSFAPTPWKGTLTKTTSAPAIFKRAILTESMFFRLNNPKSDFEEADLQSASFSHCDLQSTSFRRARLTSSQFSSGNFANCDFSDANAHDAIFESDLTGSRFDGADLANADFSSAKTDRIDFSTAKNYSPSSSTTSSAGPALTELDFVISQAKRVDFEFKVEQKEGGELESAGINTSRLKYGWGITAPGASRPIYQRNSLKTSDAMLKLASRLRGWKVHYETLDVSSTKSPKSGKELREIVLNAISEAFAQPLPPAEELAKATKEWRDGINKATSKEREARKLAKEKEEKAKAAEKKKLAKKIEKEVGKVTDVATFLKALELRVDVEKIKKATKMLRAERFQLFNDVTDTHLNGVVKSQTDADLVYACRIESDGKYACCTQNLNICGGLRGSICKHLLVLIIGLVQAGKLDPQTIDEWVAKSLDVKAELNKETMGEIFIRYKGAEAGEVDWRPTETMPEDYYAL